MGSKSINYCSRDGIYRSCLPPASIPDDPYLHFVEYMFMGNAGRPEFAAKLAMVDAKTGQRLTYGEFHNSVLAVAAGLTGIGVKQGDVVLLMLRNSVYVPVLFNAVLSIGAVVTTMNPLNTAQEIVVQLKHSKTSLIITSYDAVGKVLNLGLPLVLLDDGRTDASSFEFTHFEKLLSADPRNAPKVRIKQTDTAALLYSSGTTGLSKGVILSHGNFIAALSILEYARKEPLQDDDVALALLPMFHVAGLVWVAGDVLHSGGTLVILPKFDLVDMLEAIERYKITHLGIVPPVVVALTKSPTVNKYDLNSVRSIHSGGSPLGKKTIESFLSKHPHVTKVEQAYGMTETTGIGCGLAADTPFGSAGRLMSNTEAKVVDTETGKCLPPNNIGELLLRGPFVMQGYLNNARATAETIDNGHWIHTGDLVYFDDSGSMFVVDRLKELIKHKGFQVPPAELEALLLTHPKIADCAVVPFQDEYAGEIPLAYIVCTSGSSLTAGEVINFVAEKVAPHKKIRKVTFVDGIPRSPSGKILRKMLKEQARARL
eukprot:c23531_g1_i1 orf=443-2071(-)